MNTLIFPDSSTLAKTAAEHFINLANLSISQAEKFTVAIAGGSTPKAMYRHLASEEFVKKTDWSKIYIFFGDERMVPPDHPDSNYRMACEAFLDHIPIPAENIYRMQGEIDPDESARLYEHTLRNHFWDRSNFDLVFLGMGSDGHTASLFPGTAAIHETERWVAAHFVEKLNAWRITLTPAILNQARHIAFLVAGKDKAIVLNQVINGKYQPDKLPSQIIQSENGELTWLLDSAAAALLEQ